MLIRRPSTALSPTGRRVAIAIAGFSVLTLGLVLLVVPIPGTSVVVIPLGLAILAREFQWARRLLDGSTAALKRVWAAVRRLFATVSGRRAICLPLGPFVRGPQLAYSPASHVSADVRGAVPRRRPSPRW